MDEKEMRGEWDARNEEGGKKKEKKKGKVRKQDVGVQEEM